MVTKEAQPLKVLAGVNNQLEVYPDKLVIRRKGFFFGLFGGDQVIPIREVSTVRLFESRFLIDGCLQIVIVGSSQPIVNLSFKCSHHREAQEVCDLIEDLIRKQQVLHPEKAHNPA